MKIDIIIDARFKFCPGPLIALVENINKTKPGQIIKLLATDPATPSDIKEWASNVGHNILKIEKIGDMYEIYIEVKS